MGNRAVITTQENFDNNGVGIYLHWNGGRDSVEAFLKYCELQGYRSPENDNYGWAYLCGVITNFFGDGVSCGIDVVNHLDCDNRDNGVYIIEDWKIVGRKFFEGKEQYVHSMKDMIDHINERMPIEMQLKEEDYLMNIITPFTDDKEKMRDFFVLSKEDFLFSYSYLTEEEYDATIKDVMDRIRGK